MLPGYNVIYSDHLRREADMPTVVVGLITEPAQAEAILRDGKADIVAIAREMLCDPYWPVHAAKALGLPDWLDVLPENYAFRLFPREQEQRSRQASDAYEIPFRRKG
jgi:2,4-dienoyl-CoA reductase-like NADH-dependent reductase (Old Yellow Enzyme family)